MGLYDRDYFQLTESEKKLISKLEGKHTLTFKQLTSTPRAYYFHSSHFPNNMLDTDELKGEAAVKLLKQFQKMITRQESTEREVLNFIRDNRAYFIVGSILHLYDFGHHIAYLFPEFPLSVNHVPDFLIVGKNSGGHEFIFVEIEAVNGRTTTKEGELGEATRMGLKQVEDWQFWLGKNFRNLNSVFEKYHNKSNPLPEEFHDFDPSRIHYVVVSGRRKDYKENTYRKRRTLLKQNNIRLMHYDNLVNCAEAVISSKNYS